MLLADGTGYDKDRVVPHAYRHTAQRHADAGVPIDVLAELPDHRSLNVTRRCRYAISRRTAPRRRRQGRGHAVRPARQPDWRNARTLLDDEHARYAVGSVAVPYGTCTEPSNVAAGGNACPLRFRCAGCDHFRTDVSYLPDLTAYLDNLLRTRERLTAASGADEWARAAAARSTEEISKIRQFINRIKGDIATLTPEERARIDEAVAVVCKDRAVSLGMPRPRHAAPR